MTHRKDPFEKVEIRTANKVHRCWTWSERMGAAEDDCKQVIAKGDQYILSTIYPGHDSGYADGGWDRHGNPIGPRPLQNRFCMACRDRWANLKRGLEGAS